MMGSAAVEKRSGTALVAVSRPGSRLALRLLRLLPGASAFVPERFAGGEVEGVHPWRGPAGELVAKLFEEYGSIVVFGSVGLAVRLVAPLVRDKHTDPAVVVVDDAGSFAVSLLSGHVGGANALAETVAGLLEARAVVTTGSEVLGVPAVDLLGREFGWRIETEQEVTAVSAAVVNGDRVAVFQDAGEPVAWMQDGTAPANLVRYDSWDELLASGCSAALVITDRLLPEESRPRVHAVIYRPRSLVIGVGCNRGTSHEEIAGAVSTVLATHRLSRSSVRELATVDLKKDEAGLLDYAGSVGLPIRFFSAEELGEVRDAPNPSPMVERWTGTTGVCEPAALLASEGGRLVVPKTKSGNVTVAVARVLFAAGEE